MGFNTAGSGRQTVRKRKKRGCSSKLAYRSSYLFSWSPRGPRSPLATPMSPISLQGNLRLSQVIHVRLSENPIRIIVVIVVPSRFHRVVTLRGYLQQYVLDCEVDRQSLRGNEVLSHPQAPELELSCPVSRQDAPLLRLGEVIGSYPSSFSTRKLIDRIVSFKV